MPVEWTFLERFFVDDPGELMLVVIGSPDNNENYHYITRSELAGLSSPDSDVYFAPALRTTRGNTKGDVGHGKVLWVDVDQDTFPTYTYPPTFVVSSGKGWHLYYVLDSTLSGEVIEAYNQVLCGDIQGADKSCWNSNRLLRVPGSRNTKYPGDIRARLHRDSGHRFESGDFEVLSRLDRRTRHKIRTGDRRGYRSRSERDWAVVTELIRAGAEERLIKLVFLAQPVGDKVRDPETAEQYLSTTIAKAKDASGRRGSGELEGRDDGYYVSGRRGERRLSTFTLHPRLLLDATSFGEPDALLGSVRAAGYEWRDVTFTRTAFTSVARFDREAPVAAWQWLGRDEDIRQLLPFLMEQLADLGMPRVIATPTLGLYPRGGEWYFVTDQRTLGRAQVWDAFSGPIAALPTHRERPTFDLERDVDEATLHRIATDLPDLNLPGAIWPIIGWYAATPFKPWLESQGYRFPILNVSGTRGSGKTTLIQRVFMPLFGQKEPKSYDANTTRFVTLALLGGTNAVPVAFSEFRFASVQGFLRYVLLSYDTGHDPRGRADQTTVDYPLSAPFSLDGEDIISDPAAMERIVAVRLHPADIAEGTIAYDTYKRWQRNPPCGFGRYYLQHALGLLSTDRARSLLDQASQDSFRTLPGRTPDRIRNNYVVSYFGVLSWCLATGGSTPDFVVLSTSMANVFDPERGRTRTVADDFCESVANAVAGSRAEFRYTLVDEGRGVRVQLATAHDWWLGQLRRAGRMGLERESIKAQLRESEYVAGPDIQGGVIMYTIDLGEAQKAGLDVPAQIIRKRV